MGDSISLRDNKGFSLLEVLVATGMISLIGLASMSYIENLIKSQRQLNVSSNLQFSRQSYLGTISNQSAWEKTIQENASTEMRCLRDRNCTNGASGIFDLYDSGGNKLLDSTSPTSGFKISGEPCNDFSATSANCPIKAVLTWRAQCAAGSCEVPEELITLSYTFSSGLDLPLNKANYEFNGLTRKSLASETPVSRCASAGKIYVGRSVANFNGLTPDAAGCLPLSAFMGQNGNSSNGLNGANGNNGLNGQNGSVINGGVGGSQNLPDYFPPFDDGSSVSNSNGTMVDSCTGGCLYMQQNPDVAAAFQNHSQFVADAAAFYGLPAGSTPSIDQLAGAHYFQNGSNEERVDTGLPPPPTTP